MRPSGRHRRTAPEGGDRSFRFGRRRGPKTAKAKRIFRQAKRIVSLGAGRKSLKSLRSLDQSFRGIACFQWVSCLFVSPFSQHLRSRPEIPVRRIARRLIEVMRRIRVFDGSDHDNRLFSKRELISYLLTCRVSEPVSKPLWDKSRSIFLKHSRTSSKTLTLSWLATPSAAPTGAFERFS